MMLEWDKTNESSGIILDNIKNIKDWDTLNKVERKYSFIRLAELENVDHKEKTICDKKYFLSIHRCLFQDIYPWAGTIREVDLYKGNSAFAPSRFLDSSLNEFFDNIKKDNYLQGFSKEETAELASYYMLEMNFLHPFREGNGRTKRFYMTQLLKEAGFDFGLEKIDAEQLVIADILAFDDNEADIKANSGYFKSLINGAISPLIKEKENTLTDSKDNTKLSDLNSFLWVFDRSQHKKWFTINKTVKEAEKNLENMLQTDAGKKQIKTLLDRIIHNEKKTFEYSSDRKIVIDTALKYKKDVSNMKIGLKDTNKQNFNENIYEFFCKHDILKDNTNGEKLDYFKNKLQSFDGRGAIDKDLLNFIKNSTNDLEKNKAKQFRLELLNPKNYSNSLSSYTKNKKPIEQSSSIKLVEKVVKNRKIETPM